MDLSQARLEKVVYHRIQSGENGKELIPSDSEVDLSEEGLDLALRTYFLSSFQRPEFYRFSHPVGDISKNAVFTVLRQMLRDAAFFHQGSKAIGTILCERENQSAGSSGELFVSRFSGLVIDNKVVSGIGIYKAEEKQTFLVTHARSGGWQPEALSGIAVQKVDRGCLVFDCDEEDGFKLCVIENGRQQTSFWMQEFLSVNPWSDSYHHTRQFLDLTRSYLVDQIHEEFKVSKADQIDLMNRSVDFFKHRDQFDQREFESEVLGDAGVIESFRKFGDTFRQENDIDPIDQFEISVPAVKRQARIFKSVLKLDKNFHVYIHGNRDLIERGFDESVGKHFYKIYFDQER